MSGTDKKPRTWAWLLLFTTSGTLLCCVLPIVLVSLGLGAAVASMASAAPWLIQLSQYKLWVFLVAGVFIALAAWAVYRPGRSCPVEPELAAACQRADKWNKRFIWLAVAMWSLGFSAAYLLPLLL